MCSWYISCPKVTFDIKWSSTDQASSKNDGSLEQGKGQERGWRIGRQERLEIKVRFHKCSICFFCDWTFWSKFTEKIDQYEIDFVNFFRHYLKDLTEMKSSSNVSLYQPDSFPYIIFKHRVIIRFTALQIMPELRENAYSKFLSWPVVYFAGKK